MSIPESRRDVFATATVWSTGVNEYIPPDQDNLATEERPVKWLEALESIQLYREAPLSADEIDEAIGFRCDALPAAVNSLISIPSARNTYDGFWDVLYRARDYDSGMDPSLNQEAKASDWVANHRQIIEKNMTSHPYHIWPINVRGHWEVIFIVTEATTDKPNEYRELHSYAIVDPLLSGGKDEGAKKSYRENDYVAGQFASFFDVCRVNVTGLIPSHERLIWVPPQREDDKWSSGLRVIQFVWEMLERIQDMETSGIRNIRGLFRPMRPYFNPDYIRLSAAGAIAAKGLERENFRARICLARTRDIRPKGRPKNAPRIVADDLYCSLALPGVETIPQEFLDREKMKEVAFATWQFSTHRENGNRKEVPDLLRKSADRYQAKLEKEEQEKAAKDEEDLKKKNVSTFYR